MAHGADRDSTRRVAHLQPRDSRRRGTARPRGRATPPSDIRVRTGDWDLRPGAVPSRTRPAPTITRRLPDARAPLANASRAADTVHDDRSGDPERWLPAAERYPLATA